MAHLLKDLLLIAIYNIRHVFCNNSKPISPQNLDTWSNGAFRCISRSDRARGRLTRRCNIPVEGLFCKLQYRANITQDLYLFILFPSKFLSLFAVRINLLMISSGVDGELRHLHGREENENQSGSSDNIWARWFNIDEKFWKKKPTNLRSFKFIN